MDAKVVLDEERIKKVKEDFVPGIEKFIKKVHDPNWKLSSKKDNLEIYWMYSEGDPVVSVKGQGEVNATMEECAEMAQDFLTCQKIFDAMFIGGNKAADLGDGHAIYYATYKAPPLITNRDLVIHYYGGHLEDGTGVSLAESFEAPEIPGNKKGFVRAELHFSGVIYKPVEGDASKTFVWYVLSLDPKGSIPYMVVNAVATEQGKNVKRAQDYFNNRKKK